jgi:hypothetical protein
MTKPTGRVAAGLITLVLLAFPTITLAQSPAGSASHAALPTANAARRQGDIVVDGRLDEAAWQAARPITEFRQSQPSEGAPASLPAEVRVLYDDEALYIGARLTQPGGVVAPLARRDQLLDADGNNGSFNSLTTDKLVIRLDPYHNHLDDVWFEINPAGVKGDQFNGDLSWDPIWQGAAQVDAAGWTAEMRIPFSQLRFSREAVQTWGFQIWRYMDRLNEQVMWSFRRRDEPGGPAFFGNLSGLEISKQPRQLELLPYAVTGSTFKHAEQGDPYHDGREVRFGFGADLKYLLTSNLTLDATFNPDFGQVEVDPSVLNLSAFETFYDEKRPFFIAGASAFRFGGMRCFFCSNTSSLSAFYSRRIGRPPQLTGYVDGISSFAETPDNAAIIGAAKITGRTQGGYTVGVLDAVTGRANARYLPAGGGQEATQQVEPLTNYFVGRVKKEFRGGATTFGGVVTSTARQLDDPAAAARLRGHAEAAGFDWNHTWRGRNYSWMGTTMVSSVSGSPEAIDLTQRSSAHYFQRPDRSATGDGVFDTRYDTAATSLRGYGLFTRVGKDAGGVLRWEAMANIRSPGFEVNDLSFLSRSDFKWFNGNVAGSWTVPTRWYRSIFTSVGGATEYNYDGDRTWSQLQSFYSQEFQNYWNLRVIGIHNFISQDPRLTRGGPVVKRNGYDYGSVGVSTDARSPAVFDVQVELSRGVGAATRMIGLRPGVALKPASNVFIQVSPGYSRDEDVAQYLMAVADPTATAFSGTRYVFGHIRTTTFSLDTRINWTFTSNLTLQLFAQPFIASGQYASFREFAAPRSINKLVYGADLGTIHYDAATSSYRVDPDGPGPAAPFTFGNPDFTTASLRGTAVLRWEYKPGSTFYLVWTHERSDLDPSGSFDFAGAGRAIFRGRPTNVFQVKATYWLGR